MRKDILIVGIIILIVGVIFIPIYRSISWISSEWVYESFGRSTRGPTLYQYPPPPETPEVVKLPIEYYLYPTQRWTVNLTYGGKLPLDATIYLRDYQEKLIYKVPYSDLKKIPHGWEPVPIEGNYEFEIVMYIDPEEGFSWEVGYWIQRMQTIYPLEPLLWVGIGFVVAGAITASMGTLWRVHE